MEITSAISTEIIFDYIIDNLPKGFTGSKRWYSSGALASIWIHRQNILMPPNYDLNLNNQVGVLAAVYIRNEPIVDIFIQNEADNFTIPTHLSRDLQHPDSLTDVISILAFICEYSS